MRVITRRELLAASAGAVGLAVFGRPLAATDKLAAPEPRATGRLKQSVCRWIYQDMPLPQFSRAARDLGLVAIDLLHPDEWPVARDAGLVSSMGYPSRRRDFIATGFNDRANHALLLHELEQTIPLAARAGVPNVIAMFGNRQGKTDAEGVAACIAGLRRIAPLAEEQGVTVCVELLNSRVDHPDYHGDHTAFGVAVVTGVGSPRVKLLYDIYHMQIMDGDVIRTIRDNIAHIGHFHTGGVPGRHEIDESQELNYRAIARTIAELGFTGYVAHEFEPTRDALTSLREAVAICDV
jgi:hydroxypyruvate isomerase